MIVSTILKHKGHAVVTVAPGDTIAEVAKILSEKRIGAVPVCDADKALVGIISERDIVAALASRGTACLDLRAADLMVRDVITASPHDTIDTLMVQMTEGRFRHIPIMDGSALAGIISIGDVVKARIAEIEFERDAMKQYIAAG